MSPNDHDSPSRNRQEPSKVSHRSDRDQHPEFVMPDLPGDPYGRDTDLYPPVPDVSYEDDWEDHALNADFNVDRYTPDLVVDDRFTEVVAGERYIDEDRVSDPAPRPRRRPYRERRRQVHRAAALDEIIYDDEVVPTRRRRGERQSDDEVTGTTWNAAAITADVVTGTRPVRRSRSRSRSRSGGGNSAWGWSKIVMPSFRQILEQAFPTMLMALSLLVGFLIIQRLPSFEGLWAPIVLTPSVLLFLLADKQVHPLWRKTAMINLVSVGAFYPLLIMRQSYLRVPYVGWGNGTLQMPIVATLTIVVMLLAIAMMAAWMSQEDPEYAGVLFLPAALLVPFFAGATEIVSLRVALVIAVIVFASASVLTVVASMLPGAYPLLVAPIALAIEFMIIPLSESVPIFPLGAGTASKLLFFVILATTVGLTISMPSIAAWVRQVRDLVLGHEAALPERSR